MRKLIAYLPVLASFALLLTLSPVVSAHTQATQHVDTTPACSEVVAPGPQLQENLLFCTGVENDGQLVYKAAIAAAANFIIVGSPTAAYPSTDWSGNAITYVEFSSGYHAEYHADNVVRIYNSANKQVF